MAAPRGSPERRGSMFSHMMVGSNDIARSKTFYDALFGAIGGKPGIEDDKGRLLYLHNGGIFLVTPPIDGAPATHGNGSTIGFAMSDARPGRCLAQGGGREWRHRDRGSARHPPGRLRQIVPRLSARPRRQQIVRAAPAAGGRGSDLQGRARITADIVTFEPGVLVMWPRTMRRLSRGVSGVIDGFTWSGIAFVL